ncbi:hypothetical protein M3226_02655 [Neobacillus cucumis]|uniref:hypothetical protein n=1 Tax=Neobacillus cucumis TaxID=1740721 RepID=UPI00203BB7C6|nr:hypothetical protein [Neobacillus cucumis]MCM3724602.1 hypothetical protein [Neobacillus cucumis]
MSEELQTEETAVLEESRPRKKKKVWLGLVVVLLVASIGGGLFWKHVQTVKAEEAAAEAKKKAIKNYEKNMGLALAAAIVVGTHSEKMADQYHDVWYSAIFNDRYTTSDGTKHSYGSFNQAIKDQNSVYEQSGDNLKLLSEMVVFEGYMNKLKNPPSKYEQLYQELVDLYATASSFEKLAESPSGSLQSYTNEFNQRDSELAEKIKSLQVQLPE